MVERFWPKPDVDVAPDGPFVRYSDYEALRAELDAVKREAVEALKPFADVAPVFDNTVRPSPTRDADTVHAWATTETGHVEITVRDFRAARAFTEKHG